MGKKKRSPLDRGNCLDCENFKSRVDGPYKGWCAFSGEKISHIDAYITHDCFSLATWWAGKEGYEDEQED